MAPILLIHGLFGSLNVPGILSAFGDARVLAPDLIGYGSCREGAPADWALHEQADHVATWLRERTDEPVHVVGHSVGGAIHLVAGARARGGWSVPDWLSRGATTDTDISGTGHLMMLEEPELFARTLRQNLSA